MTQAEFKFRRGNPDVLTSIANLSNDEVFTPPEFANRMLNTLQEAWAASNGGANIWEDSSVTFLDPFTKSGVFLREITERLTKGLEKEISDLQERVNHILTKQVFGIGITELTTLLARRSVYCTKWANGEHSIATAFDDVVGNIWFERTEHTWVGGADRVITVDEAGKEVIRSTNGRCKYCGANQVSFERGASSETHAYALIHHENVNDRIAEIFGGDVKFDVVIGNPPYQISDGGNSASARPLYDKFVEQARKIEPKYLTMVIPARWYSGGKGLDEFRESMLKAGIVELHDFFDAQDVFPGVDISGGVCYFLSQPGYEGPTRVVGYRGGASVEAIRPLSTGTSGQFIRFNEAVSILEKVWPDSGATFGENVSSRKPFGLPTNVKVHSEAAEGRLAIFAYPKNGFIPESEVERGHEMVNNYKVLISYAYGERGNFPYLVLGKPFIASPGSVCSETYIVARTCETLLEANNVISYMRTRFFRFLVLLLKNTQHATSKVYALVPTQDYSKAWTDEELYSMYSLEPHEISFIESLVRPAGELGE